MSYVSTHNTQDAPEAADRRVDPEGVSTIEAYETNGTTVFYDAENPLAWVEATRAVVLSDVA